MTRDGGGPRVDRPLPPVGSGAAPLNGETPAVAGVSVQSGYGESNSGIQLGKLMFYH